MSEILFVWYVSWNNCSHFWVICLQNWIELTRLQRHTFERLVTILCTLPYIHQSITTHWYCANWIQLLSSRVKHNLKIPNRFFSYLALIYLILRNWDFNCNAVDLIWFETSTRYFPLDLKYRCQVFSYIRFQK